MKLSELKTLIREEIRKVINEGILQTKWKTLSDDAKEKILLSYISDPDEAMKYIDFEFNELPDEVISGAAKLTQTQLNDLIK